MNILRIFVLLCAAALFPFRLYGVEILEADPELSARISGGPRTDVEFGTAYFHGLHPGTYMLGSFYAPDSREALTVLGFRLTEGFLREWEQQGDARLLFSFIRFQQGDPRKICPIHVELLDPNHPTATTAAGRSRQPRPRLGSISRNELKEDRLYEFPLTFDPTLSPGDTYWIGIDCTNPLESEDHNLIISGDLYLQPGGAPPLLVAGSPEATTHAVHGMSLLQSLNRRFSSPENIGEIADTAPVIPQWVNPFRTARKMETLEEFRLTLEQQLSKLPDCPFLVSDRFLGFHSSIKPTNETWTLRFPVRNKESSIALYPAVRWKGKDSEVYAFPKRFIITAIPSSGAESVTVADWSGTDFPAPGPMPVIFPFPWDNYGGIHITVLKGTPVPGGHTFALSEVAFAQVDDTDPVYLRTEPENSLEVPPYWSVDHATDGRTVFGFSSASVHAAAGTFRVLLDESDLPQIIIRQLEPTSWDRFEFYPTATTNGVHPEGFPRGFRIDFSEQDDFSSILHTVATTDPVTVHTADQPYVFAFPKVNARCVRITLEPADGSSEGRLLQLEEITVNGGFPLTERRKGMELELAGVSSDPDPGALYDRVINGQDLHIPLLRRINLIRRHILAGELNRVETAGKAIRAAHARSMGRLKAGGVVLATSLAGLFIIHQKRQSKKAQLRIRHRIQQDLHDEIGSQLSAISLIADMNKDAPELTGELRADLNDVNQCAREAIASLAEVIWLTNEEILTLDQCFHVMQKRAMQMVHTIKLELDFPKQVPQLELSYKTKRNLILLFTEALNNALKHSQADTIHAGAQLRRNRELTLSIHDNGKGFSPETASNGIGLKSMNDRAATLGGRLEISSAPGNGTTVRFQGRL